MQNVLSNTYRTYEFNSLLTNLPTECAFLTGQWPPGSYCILASGDCPAGFTRSEGHLRALRQYAATEAYITQATFGSSKIECHGDCGQYGQWVGDLYIAACQRVASDGARRHPSLAGLSGPT